MGMEICLLIGIFAVASNPSAYYAALGLVWGSGVGCFALIKGGVVFLSLVLFLVYLGGMMVVFAYCTALVEDPFPETWGSRIVLVYIVGFSLLLVIAKGVQKGYQGIEFLSISVEWDVASLEWWGVGNLFCDGGVVLLLGGWALLLTLFVVLETVGGSKWGGVLRAV